MTKVIKNGQLVLENGILWDGVLVIEGDKIAAYGKKGEVTLPEGAEVIDAEGAYVGPGFVDIHVHAGEGKCICFQMKEATDYLLSHGETSVLASPDYSMDFKTLMDGVNAIKKSLPACPSVKGINFEGPFINPKYGARADKNPWRDRISPQQFQAFVDEAGALAKIWVIAPERPDVLPFLEYARQVNPAVVFAIGHSEATPMEIRALGKFRPTIQTHSLNATGRTGELPGTRGIGPDEYCLRESSVYTELICDSCALHVHPEMQQLLLHAKGVEKVILITDHSHDEDCETPPELRRIKDLNFDRNGDLSGSKMTMEQACKNIMTHTSCGIAQAFLMASTNPARAIGMDGEIGSIGVGKQADLVFVDDRFSVKRVILGGNVL